jgi:hypothetical protein
VLGAAARIKEHMMRDALLMIRDDDEYNRQPPCARSPRTRACLAIRVPRNLYCPDSGLFYGVIGRIRFFREQGWRSSNQSSSRI